MVHLDNMGIIWTTWWRGLLDDTKNQITKLYAKWFLTRRFVCYPYINLWKTCESGAGHFWSYGHNFNKISRGLLDDATYQITRLYVYLKVSDNIYHVSHYKKIKWVWSGNTTITLCRPTHGLCKHVNRGRDNLWPHGHNLNKKGKYLQNNATQNIKAISLVVSDKKIFKVFENLFFAHVI